MPRLGCARLIGVCREGGGYAHQVVTVHLAKDVIRVFHGPELITTVPRMTRKEVVVRKSGEHDRRKIV
ncbi:hypothetical protein AB0M19_13105 [Streptomyces sp. NPDC051920]|uniref:hypothetical protein n=1 Tax=Streptomyces sp. NPDC051920 TaxID=3155523 RepID=UPI0034403EE8